MEDVERSACQPHQRGVGVGSGPPGCIDVSSDRGDRCDLPQPGNDVRTADVPAMDDVVGPGQMLFGLGPQQAVSEIMPILNIMS